MKESRPAFWKQRALGLILALFGFLFGTSFGENGFCLGDRIFSLLGLSVWSGQIDGLHYSAFLGLCIMLAGLGLTVIRN